MARGAGCHMEVLLLVAALLLQHAEGSRLLLARGFTHPALPDYTVYHRKQDLLTQVANIVKANPDIMSMEVKSSSDRNYTASMQVVHVEVGGITTKNEGQRPKARILLDFGEHGREFISPELGLNLLRLLGSPAALKALVGGGQRGEKLLSLLHRIEFKILPMENERGRDLVEAGQLCERKNGRGVDTNRNWEVDWGRKEKDYDPSEEFPGTAPFSEPEAQIVLDVAKSFKPHVWLNIHSGMEAMFTPWDHKGEVAQGAQEALKMLTSIRDSLFTSNCVVGSGGKSVGYLAHGTATDYMFEKLKVPMAFTWEIYGDLQAPFHDCFRMFNPLTHDHVQKVVTLWLKAILQLVELLPSHPVMISEGIFNDLKPVSGPSTQQTPGGTPNVQPKPDGLRVGWNAGSARETIGVGGSHVSFGSQGGRQPASSVTVSPLPGTGHGQVITNIGLGIAVTALVVFVIYSRYQQQRGSKSAVQAQIRSWGP